MKTEYALRGDAERALLTGILRQAVLDLENSAAQVRADARAWFLSPSEDLGSLIWVCGHLGIDPDRLRARLEESAADVQSGLTLMGLRQ